VGVPILCYHKIGDPKGRSLNVLERDFLRQVGFLRRRGFRLAALDHFGTLPPRCAILTFDDVYVTTAEALLKVERDLDLSGTVFPVTACVGEVSEWDRDRARPLADWETLARLRDAGFEIGNHSETHRDLDEADDQELREEIIRAESELASRLGVSVRTMAYPYGRFDARALDVLRKRGYVAAVTTRSGIARRRGDPFRLPRIKISYSDGVGGLLYKMYIRPVLRV
jgi:peptidoglycan/xylan/chitin deacetylase (PgdA/CDA1 family)